MAGVDQNSVALSGMIVQKAKKLQTMTQYDLVPEVIYNSIEIKIRDVIETIVGPIHHKQGDLLK